MAERASRRAVVDGVDHGGAKRVQADAAPRARVHPTRLVRLQQRFQARVLRGGDGFGVGGRVARFGCRDAAHDALELAKDVDVGALDVHAAPHASLDFLLFPRLLVLRLGGRQTLRHLGVRGIALVREFEVAHRVLEVAEGEPRGGAPLQALDGDGMRGSLEEKLGNLARLVAVFDGLHETPGLDAAMAALPWTRWAAASRPAS